MEQRPSSWPVRRQRQQAAAAESAKRLANVEEAVVKIATSMFPPGLSATPQVRLQDFDNRMMVYEERLHRIEKLLLLADFDQVDKTISKLLGHDLQTRAEPEREPDKGISESELEAAADNVTSDGDLENTLDQDISDGKSESAPVEYVSEGRFEGAPDKEISDDDLETAPDKHTSDGKLERATDKEISEGEFERASDKHISDG